ncbi:cobalamin-dependent protein [Alkalihalophilus marmarensis]|uniref:B12-binding domain-containing protein n=1 Tax=Alkalihalophilus marmarensis DSM 21297 TaxID=1188261 RepID=U6SPX5_9BACI|nr:cobalamin-dependent protein [Alkalihalophilus marmarensis]ERN52940.1 hypothetical protein A33I_14755 [Alkalihalophilus marmarensis DSM 21297]MCM3489193.1 cobalamin-dependent protein [Alkalihalophilus marmarensis]
MQNEVNLFVKALLSGNQKEAWNISQMVLKQQGHSLPLYNGLITESMREIGRLWEENEINVADEHLATSTCDFVLSLYHSKRTANLRYMNEQPKAMFLCIEEEQHDIGLKLTSHLFEQKGWKTRLYGANLPLDALVSAAIEWKPEVIGLSVTIPYHLVNLNKFVRTLEDLPHRPTVLVGGRLVAEYDLRSHCSDQTLLLKDLNELDRWLENCSAGVKVNDKY